MRQRNQRPHDLLEITQDATYSQVAALWRSGARRFPT
jgi:hypothetical protein